MLILFSLYIYISIYHYTFGWEHKLERDYEVYMDRFKVERG